MVANLSKIIIRSVFGIVLILLIVESSLLVPAYMNLVFNTHAIASKGAKNNYISEEDLTNLEKNLTANYTNERYGAVDTETLVSDIGPEGNTYYLPGDTYGHNPPDGQILQRGDSYTFRVEVTYYFLMPQIWSTRGTDARRVGLTMPLSYEVPVTCLKYYKD